MSGPCERSLRILRDEFAKTGEQQPPLRHGIIISWGEDAPHWLSKEEERIVLSQWKQRGFVPALRLSCLPGQIWQADGKATVTCNLSKRERRDHDLEDAGEYCTIGRWRYYIGCEEAYSAGVDDVEGFRCLARDAGRLVGEFAECWGGLLMADAPLPHEFVQRVCLDDECLRWVLAVYHIAWHSGRGSLLNAKRRCLAFLPGSSIAKISDYKPGVAIEVEATRHTEPTEVFPDFYYSLLEQGVYRASAFALDVILETESRGRPARTPEKADHEPDEKGFVKKPLDEKAYLPANKIRDDYADIVRKHRDLVRILDEHPEIKRWRPWEQRLSVHVGDWMAFVQRQKDAAAKAVADATKRPFYICSECKKVLYDPVEVTRCPHCGGGDLTPFMGRPER